MRGEIASRSADTTSVLRNWAILFMPVRTAESAFGVLGAPWSTLTYVIHMLLCRESAALRREVALVSACDISMSRRSSLSTFSISAFLPCCFLLLPAPLLIFSSFSSTICAALSSAPILTLSSGSTASGGSLCRRLSASAQIPCVRKTHTPRIPSGDRSVSESTAEMESLANLRIFSSRLSSIPTTASATSLALLKCDSEVRRAARTLQAYGKSSLDGSDDAATTSETNRLYLARSCCSKSLTRRTSRETFAVFSASVRSLMR
mmetsp:Transcript_3415/g.10363  ORF Transcript_3415/g.10363 Transcript_3415/m.10363 type:complete len:263 (-) Transcript_3415:650-1438(-)